MIGIVKLRERNARHLFVRLTNPDMSQTYCWTIKIQLIEEIRRSPVELGSLSHHVQGFINPRWYRISSILHDSKLLIWRMIIPTLTESPYRFVKPDCQADRPLPQETNGSSDPATNSADHLKKQFDQACDRIFGVIQFRSVAKQIHWPKSYGIHS